MHDKTLKLTVGGGTAALLVLATISSLTNEPEPITAATESVVAAAESAANAVSDLAETAENEAEDLRAEDAPAEAPAAASETNEMATAAEAGATMTQETAEAAPVGSGSAEADEAELADPDAEPVTTVEAAADGTGSGAAAPFDGVDFAAMSPEQTEAFGAQVRSYLLANPGVLQEVVTRLEEQEAAQRVEADAQLVDAHMDRLTEDGFSWVGGNPDGDITIVEFLDYRCGFCRRAMPEVEELIASDGNIRLIVKEFPILGEASLVSSQFAIATLITEGPEAYKAVHDALIALETDPTEAVLSDLAATLELDADAILVEMQSDEVMQRIAETRELAQAMQISGTPTFVFGNRMVRGYAPLETMQQIVAEERAEG